MKASARQVVLVTAGGRGLRRAHCLELAASVVVNDGGAVRDESAVGDTPAADVVAAIGVRGRPAMAHGGSVSDGRTPRAWCQTALTLFAKLTGVVSNAGIRRDAGSTGATGELGHRRLRPSEVDIRSPEHARGCLRGPVKYGATINGYVVNTVQALIFEAISTKTLAALAKPASTDRPAQPYLGIRRIDGVVAVTRRILRVGYASFSGIDGYAKLSRRYRAESGDSYAFDEIGLAVSWLWHSSLRGLAGPLPKHGSLFQCGAQTQPLDKV